MSHKICLEDFERIVTILYENNRKIEEYMDKLENVDSALLNLFYENTYSDTLYNEREVLAKQLFGDELWDTVTWFLYEVSLMNETSNELEWNIEANGVKYLVKDLSSFMNYARHGLCLPKKL